MPLIIDISSAPRRIRAIGSIIVAAELLAGTAHAETIPVISMTPAGPEQSIPVGTAFYLTGTVDDTVSDVQVVIVATGTTTLFGTTGPSCDAFLAGAPTTDPSAGEKVGTKALSDITRTGATSASSVWTGSGKEPYDSEMPVYLPPQWHRATEADPGTYKVLVPSDHFFSSAGAYCLYVLTATHHKKTDATTLKNTLLKAAEKVSSCASEKLKQCLDERAQERDAAIKSMGVLTGESAKELRAAANVQWARLKVLASAPHSIDALLGTWSRTEVPGGAGGFTAPLSLPSFNSVASDPLARATLGLLIAHNVVYGAAPQAGAAARFVTSNGAIEVQSLRILPDGETIVVSPNYQLDTKTSALTLDDEDLTLRDLLEFQRGSIRVAGSYQDVRSVRQQLDAIFAEVLSAQPISDEQRAFLKAVDERVRLLAKNVEAALLAALSNTTPVVGTTAATLHDLGAWLSAPGTLTACDEANAGAWGRKPGCLCVAAAPAGAWPGYRQIELESKADEPLPACTPADKQDGAKPPYAQSPLEFLHGELSAYETALDKLTTVNAALTATIDLVTTEQATTAPVTIRASYTQDQWVFSYVTPFVGVGFVQASDAFPLFYLGVQVHLVPNLVDDPLWTHRGDILRTFALELGMSTVAGSFGSQDRFSTWRSIPPAFFGLAIHPLPYVSGSIGGVLLGRRSSTVPEETSKAWVGLYFGLSVQANIPDLAANLKGRTTSSVK